MEGQETERSAASLYEEYYSLLGKVAAARFGLPPDAVENAIQDVFVSFLRVSAQVENPRAWLVGAICNASRDYWRFCEDESNEGAGMEPATGTSYAERLLCGQVLARLPESSRRILELHYLEGFTAREIAARLHTSVRYTEQMIHRSLKRARVLARRRA